MALSLGHSAGRRRGDGRDPPRCLRFRRRLLRGGQRWLGWDDHTLVTGHWSAGAGGCRGSGVLKNSKQPKHSISALLNERLIATKVLDTVTFIADSGATHQHVLQFMCVRVVGFMTICPKVVETFQSKA